jgi:hypothetical protein
LYKIYDEKIETDLRFAEAAWLAAHLNKINKISTFEYASKIPYSRYK